MQSLAKRMVRHRSRCVFALLAAFAAARAGAFDWQVDITPAAELFPALQLSQVPRAGVATAIGDSIQDIRHGGRCLVTLNWT